MVTQNELLDDWVWILLSALNGVTFFITIGNLVYLYRTFPKIDIKKKTINDDDLLSYRNAIAHKDRIQKYFYFITIIPLFVSATCHYGAQFPAGSIWIFPGLNIVIAIAYLLFIRLMILSCNGLTEIKYLLINKPDECNSLKNKKCYKKCCKALFCKLFLKENAFLGLKHRILLCFLIILKPIVNYATSYFEYDFGSEYQQKSLRFVMKGLTLLTTLIPMQCMKSFHETLEPYTRLRRSKIKRKFVTFLSPICQLQQSLVGFIFGLWTYNGFGDIENKYVWVVAYGILMCFEMVIFSLFSVWIAFNPKDLTLWEYSESFLIEKENNKNQLT